MNVGDRNKAVIAQAIQAAWRNDEFKAQLTEDPAGTLRGLGAEIPDGAQLTVLQDSASLTHAVVAQNDTTYNGRLQAVMNQAGAGHKVQIVHNAPGQFHLVIPVKPHDLAARGAVGALVGGPLGAVHQDINMSFSVMVSVAAVAVAVATASLS